jgi:CubicO group peptidase (beta-lactamase class C family)
MLGLLGAVPVAAGGAWAASAGGWTAAADDASSAAGRVPQALRPGGEFDRMLADLAAQDTLSGTVLLKHRDRTVLSRSFGMADKQRSIPNGPDTVFALGSITKIFTAIAVGQLAQQGKIAFHETLGTYLGGFPAETANQVTVHQMLTHTSGMGDFIGSPVFRTEAVKWTSPEQVMDAGLAMIREEPLKFAPGAGLEYSNSAYHVLGCIVATVAGTSYHDYIREHIFRPAGMTRSDFLTKPQWREDPRAAHPYSSAHQPDGQRVDAIDNYAIYTHIGTPAANSHSTAPDLAAFTKALLGHELLSPAYTELMLSAKVPKKPLGPSGTAPVPFNAYATTNDIVNGQWAVGHNGRAPGTAVNLDWFPQSDWTAVVLTNYDGIMPGPTTSPPEAVARRLITQP